VDGGAWPFSTGRVDKAMIRERLFPAGPSTICIMCGPPPMIAFACVPNLEKLGYAAGDCIAF
jgi:Oxidoreductase NAD-binding domain